MLHILRASFARRRVPHILRVSYATHTRMPTPTDERENARGAARVCGTFEESRSLLQPCMAHATLRKRCLHFVKEGLTSCEGRCIISWNRGLRQVPTEDLPEVNDANARTRCSANGGWRK